MIPQQIRDEVEKGCGKLIPLENNNPNSWEVTCGAWINDKIRLCPSCKAKLSILTEYDQSIKEMIEEAFNMKLDYTTSRGRDLKNRKNRILSKIGDNCKCGGNGMLIDGKFICLRCNKSQILSKIGDNSEVEK